MKAILTDGWSLNGLRDHMQVYDISGNDSSQGNDFWLIWLIELGVRDVELQDHQFKAFPSSRLQLYLLPCVMGSDRSIIGLWPTPANRFQRLVILTSITFSWSPRCFLSLSLFCMAQRVPRDHKKQEKVRLQPEQGQRADSHQHHPQRHPACW